MNTPDALTKMLEMLKNSPRPDTDDLVKALQCSTENCADCLDVFARANICAAALPALVRMVEAVETAHEECAQHARLLRNTPCSIATKEAAITPAHIVLQDLFGKINAIAAEVMDESEVPHE